MELTRTFSLISLATNISEDIDFSNFKYTFYWNGAQNPLDENSEKVWKLYDESYQNLLNEGYVNYLNDKNESTIRMNNYTVHFDKLIQIKNHKEAKVDNTKIRPIKIIDNNFDQFIGN